MADMARECNLAAGGGRSSPVWPACSAAVLRQAEVTKAYAGQPTHPVMLALMPLAADYGIEQRHLQAVIDGCQMDLEQTR